jgi:hypothetical protein
MSGRLVISRHKSWHVWNQDNQEKVLKDERLAREQEQENQEKERKRTQEKNLEILNGSVSLEPSSKALDEKGKKKKNETLKQEPPPQTLGELAPLKPWYMKKHEVSKKPRKEFDLKIDESEDPMNQFLQKEFVDQSVLPYADAPAPAAFSLEELRAKRLKREKMEKKRASVLLANNDIYGADSNKKRKF